MTKKDAFQGPARLDVNHGKVIGTGTSGSDAPGDRFNAAAPSSPERSVESQNRFSETRPTDNQEQQLTGAATRPRNANLGNLPSREELEARSGNYILSFGFAGAGKSSFQSHLARWILEGRDFIPHVAKTDANDASTRLINIWREDWRSNRFPDSTIPGERNVTELRLKATPNSGQKTPVVFSFLEISGEDLESVIPKDGAATMLGSLRAFITNPKISPMMIFFVDPDHDDNDTMFFNLLDYLEANFKRPVIERLSLLVLIPKPKTALANMRQSPKCRAEYNGLEHIEELNNELVELYLETFLPSAYSRIKVWKGEWQHARFCIGDPVPGRETHFENMSFVDISKIFSWIYTRFTGKKLGQSPGGKLKDFFTKLE